MSYARFSGAGLPSREDPFRVALGGCPPGCTCASCQLLRAGLGMPSALGAEDVAAFDPSLYHVEAGDTWNAVSATGASYTGVFAIETPTPRPGAVSLDAYISTQCAAGLLVFMGAPAVDTQRGGITRVDLYAGSAAPPEELEPFAGRPRLSPVECEAAPVTAGFSLTMNHYLAIGGVCLAGLFAWALSRKRAPTTAAA